MDCFSVRNNDRDILDKGPRKVAATLPYGTRHSRSLVALVFGIGSVVIELEPQDLMHALPRTVVLSEALGPAKQRLLGDVIRIASGRSWRFLGRLREALGFVANLRFDASGLGWLCRGYRPAWDGMDLFKRGETMKLGANHMARFANAGPNCAS
jgi:hypothetical protein